MPLLMENQSYEVRRTWLSQSGICNEPVNLQLNYN